MEEGKFRQGSHSRWLYFFLGVFVAAAIGLAIALGVTLGKDDDDQSTIIVQSANESLSTEDSQGLCITSSCVYQAGQVLQAMDKTVDPCEDFYQYACGNWMRTHSIPEGYSSYSRLTQVGNTIALDLKGLLEKPYDSVKESASIRKAKTLYQSCLNEEQLTKLGTEPLKKLVRELGTWPLTSTTSFNSSVDLETLLVKLRLVGQAPFIAVSVGQDLRNSSQFIITIDQLWLGLNREYMVQGRNSAAVTAEEELKRQLAIHVLGVTPSSALTTAISDVVEFEIKLAQMSASQTDRRDLMKFYKKMNISQLSTSIPKFSWMTFLTGYFNAANVTITEDTEVMMLAEDYITSMLTLYETTDSRTVANYMLMYIVRNYVGYLSKDIRDLFGPLNKILYGVTQARPRWQTCVMDLEKGVMSAAVDQLYVSSYFSSTAEDKVSEMVGDIRESMKQMIREVQWMDAATKTKVIEKVDAIIEKIGYPNNLFSETVMEGTYGDVDYQPETYFQNKLDIFRYFAITNSKRLQRTSSRKIWTEHATDANALHTFSRNDIMIPAGILQPPYYEEDFPMSLMFGGIGMIIGHEITHGFDDKGRRYDKEGNNVPWWSDSSVKNFEDLASCFADQYSQQVVLGQNVNGNLTLGENIADNGGVKSAFLAFQKWQSLHGKQPVLPGLGLSHEQLFFLSFAQGWCYLITDQGNRYLLLTDQHSPASVRVRVTLSNSQHFADAFRCPVGSKMNGAKKCALW